MGALAAAAVAAGSLTVLAMVGRSLMRSDARPMATKPGAPAVQGATAGHGDAATNTVSSPAPGVPLAKHAAGTVVDRKLREEIRARLMSPLVARGVEHDPHTGLTIPSGSTGPSHNLSREYLQQRIREDFYPLASACYEGALAKKQDLRGQIVIDFMIVGDKKVGGIVDQAKINERTDIADAEFTACVRESMLSMVFAPPDDNGWVTVTYPFKFSPGDDDGDEAPRDP
jgi:hypothetical protein